MCEWCHSKHHTGLSEKALLFNFQFLISFTFPDYCFFVAQFQLNEHIIVFHKLSASSFSSTQSLFVDNRAHIGVFQRKEKLNFNFKSFSKIHLWSLGHSKRCTPPLVARWELFHWDTLSLCLEQQVQLAVSNSPIPTPASWQVIATPPLLFSKYLFH